MARQDFGVVYDHYLRIKIFTDVPRTRDQLGSGVTAEQRPKFKENKGRKGGYSNRLHVHRYRCPLKAQRS